MTMRSKTPRRRSLFSRLRRSVQGPAGVVPVARHAPLSQAEMMDKIFAPLASYLAGLGFMAEREDTWTRKRTAWATDHVFAPALTKSAPELIGVNVHVGLRCEPTNQLLSELCGGAYELQRPLLSPLLSEACLPEKVSSRWNFWSNAFDEEELDDMLWHLERYAFPFMESFSTLDDIQKALQQRSELFSEWPEKVAAVLTLAGRRSEAQAVLARACTGNLSSEQLRVVAAIGSALEDGSLELTVSKIRSTVD